MNEWNERKSEKSTAVSREGARGNRKAFLSKKLQAPHSKNSHREETEATFYAGDLDREATLNRNMKTSKKKKKKLLEIHGGLRLQTEISEVIKLDMLFNSCICLTENEKKIFHFKFSITL